MERRDVIKGLALSALLAQVPASATAAATGAVRRRAPLAMGLQLFTVLGALEKDFQGTLDRVAALGYREVETLGSFGRDPREVRDMIAQAGLRSPAQHLMPETLYRHFQVPPTTDAERAAMSAQFDQAFAPDRVDAFISEAIGRAKILGQHYVVWQFGWRDRYTLADAERFARAFNRAGELCAAAGLQFCYHNHDHEFAPIGGVRPFDILMGQTDSHKVKVEIDFHWARRGPADPAEVLARYPGRFRMCHLKDRAADGSIVTMGTGREDFPRLIAEARAAGIEHFFFEFDRPVDPMREVEAAAGVLLPILSR